MKLNYDDLLSNFAFNVNLCRYTRVVDGLQHAIDHDGVSHGRDKPVETVA